MTRLIILSMCMLLILSSGTGQEKLSRYSVHEARQHIGEVASVRGAVTEVEHVGKGPALLHLGGYHPDQVLTVVVSNTRSFGNLATYRGSVIEVVGRITLDHGKARIQLASRRQLRYVEWGTKM